MLVHGQSPAVAERRQRPRPHQGRGRFARRRSQRRPHPGLDSKRVAQRRRWVSNRPGPGGFPSRGYRVWKVIPVSNDTWLTSLAVYRPSRNR